MSNVFIRTNIAPYRVDIYNEIHERLDTLMCFYTRQGSAQRFDIADLEDKCNFTPVYLKGKYFGGDTRKWCYDLWKILRKEKPKVVIVPEFQISAMQVLLYRWLTRSKFKVVSMTDDSHDMISKGNDFTKLHAWLRNHLAMCFDDFIVVTPEVEKWYRDKYGKGIWMPIIMDDVKMEAYYKRLLPKSRELAEKYGIKGKKVLLSVSRLVDLKNIHRVINAFAKCDSNAVLVIVGDGSERESLMEHAAKIEKKIIFTGRFDGDDLYAWYNLASVFILASYQEPFGAVTNEALLAGCRVVISNKCGSSCLVSRKNGETIDPFDLLSMTTAIDRQLNNSNIPNLKDGRKSLMDISFGERIDNLITNLNK